MLDWKAQVALVTIAGVMLGCGDDDATTALDGGPRQDGSAPIDAFVRARQRYLCYWTR